MFRDTKGLIRSRESTGKQLIQWPKEKGHIIIYKTLHRKLKIEAHEPHKNPGWIELCRLYRFHRWNKDCYRSTINDTNILYRMTNNAPSHESGWSCIYVLGVSIITLSTILICDFVIILTVIWYFLFFILSHNNRK